MLKFAAALGASVVLMGATPVAHAASSSAAVSGLVFELVSLDGDGATTPLIWGDAGAQLFTSTQSQSYIDWSASGAWSSYFLNTQEPQFVEGTGSILPPLQADSAGAGAQTQAGGLSASYQSPSEGGTASVSASSYGNFTLSARTTLRVSGLLTLGVSGPGADDLGLPLGALGGHDQLLAEGMAFGAVGLGPLSGGGLDAVASSLMEVLDAQTYAQGSNEGLPTDAYDKSLSRSFSLTLTNSSFQAMVGEFSLTTMVQGTQVITTAVPEPSTVCLVLAGVGLTLVGRRQRRVAA